jgi:hypothetical protein
MAFSVIVEMLNLRLRKTTTPPVHLHEPMLSEAIAHTTEPAAEVGRRTAP